MFAIASEHHQTEGGIRADLTAVLINRVLQDIWYLANQERDSVLYGLSDSDIGPHRPHRRGG